MNGKSSPRTRWVSLPPLDGGLWVAMVTEVLDERGIPNLVKTDLESGGLGMVMGTQALGRPWRIQVPESEYERAMEVFRSLMGNVGEAPEADSEPAPP